MPPLDSPSWSQKIHQTINKKINPHAQSDEKQDAICNASWMALGQILVGFGLQAEKQDEAKLAPKSNIFEYQIQYQKEGANRIAQERQQEAPPTIGTTILEPRGGIKGGVNPSLEREKGRNNVGKKPEATFIPPDARGWWDLSFI